MRLLLALAMSIGWGSEVFACNPYMTVSSPHFNPARFQKIFAPTAGGITLQEYDEILARFQSFYGPMVNARGAELLFPDSWNNEDVNGYARQQDGQWLIFALGGYARHPLATKDAFIFLVCHEVGHHLGGAPNYGISSFEWAAAEGQADYFSTLKCMRQMLRNEDNEAAVAALNPPQFLRESCEQQWSNRIDQLLCIRGAMGGYAMTQIWEDGAGTFAFDTPSQDKVTTTSYWHPEHQCRIDTYFQGALCEIDAHVDVSMADASVGTCNASTGHSIGLRPGCWYAEATRTN